MVGNHQEVLYSGKNGRNGLTRIEAQSSCSLTLKHNEHNNNFTQTSPWTVPTVDTPGPWWPNRPVPGDYSPSPRCPRCPVARVLAFVPARVFPGHGHRGACWAHSLAPMSVKQVLPRGVDVGQKTVDIQILNTMRESFEVN